MFSYIAKKFFGSVNDRVVKEIAQEIVKINAFEPLISKLSDDELKASIGVLKKKGLIEIKNDKLIFNGDKEGISKKTSEESFLELLPLEYNILSEEQQNAFKSLKDRKEMIQLIEESELQIKEEVDLIVERGTTREIMLVNFSDSDGGNYLVLPKIKVQTADRDIIVKCPVETGIEISFRE